MSMMDKAWIEETAKEYDYALSKNDAYEYDSISAAIKKFGLPPPCLTKDILMEIVEWKSPRSIGYASENAEQFIREVTQVSFAAENEELKIGVLTLMKGVRYRMASTILHFYSPDRYTIMDWRAWKSLKVEGKISGEMKDTFESWQKYTEVCREIAKQNHVSLRTLDKALWAYKGEDKR